MNSREFQGHDSIFVYFARALQVSMIHPNLTSTHLLEPKGMDHEADLITMEENSHIIIKPWKSPPKHGCSFLLTPDYGYKCICTANVLALLFCTHAPVAHTLECHNAHYNCNAEALQNLYTQDFLGSDILHNIKTAPCAFVTGH